MKTLHVSVQGIRIGMRDVDRALQYDVCGRMMPGLWAMGRGEGFYNTRDFDSTRCLTMNIRHRFMTRVSIF